MIAKKIWLYKKSALIVHTSTVHTHRQTYAFGCWESIVCRRGVTSRELDPRFSLVLLLSPAFHPTHLTDGQRRVPKCGHGELAQYVVPSYRSPRQSSERSYATGSARRVSTFFFFLTRLPAPSHSDKDNCTTFQRNRPHHLRFIPILCPKHLERVEKRVVSRSRVDFADGARVESLAVRGPARGPTRGCHVFQKVIPLLREEDR